MKIAWTACVLDGGTSGIASYIVNLLRALGKIAPDDDFHLFYPKDNEPYLGSLSHNFFRDPISSYLENPLLNIAWHNTVLPYEIRNNHCDLLHIPSIRRIPLSKTCPIIATVHDMAPFSMPNKYGFARAFYHHQVLSRLVHRCDRIITVSHYTKQEILKYTNYSAEKIHVIYNGIDTHFFRPVPKDEARQRLKIYHQIDRPFFFYLSRLEHPAKNHLRLLQAFELFKEKTGSDHMLALAGPDWFRSDKIKAYAAKSPYADSIRFLGKVPQDLLPTLYSACEAMVFPSLFEGFGFPLPEAMACRAPVICSETTSLGELAKGYAVTFDPTEPEAISAAMTNHLENPPTSEHLDKCQEYAQSFKWKPAAKRVLDLYQEVYEEQT